MFDDKTGNSFDTPCSEPPKKNNVFDKSWACLTYSTTSFDFRCLNQK